MLYNKFMYFFHQLILLMWEEHDKQPIKPNSSHILIETYIHTKHIYIHPLLLWQKEKGAEGVVWWAKKKMAMRLWASKSASYLKISTFNRGFATGIYQPLWLHLLILFLYESVFMCFAHEKGLICGSCM